MDTLLDEERECLEHFFKVIDVNQSGGVDAAELVGYTRTHMPQHFDGKKDFTETNVKEVMKAIVGSDKPLHMEGFLKFCV